jgi:hypothetical protein
VQWSGLLSDPPINAATAAALTEIDALSRSLSTSLSEARSDPRSCAGKVLRSFSVDFTQSFVWNSVKIEVRRSTRLLAPPRAPPRPATDVGDVNCGIVCVQGNALDFADAQSVIAQFETAGIALLNGVDRDGDRLEIEDLTAAWTEAQTELATLPLREWDVWQIVHLQGTVTAHTHPTTAGMLSAPHSTAQHCAALC